jgi:hypothetical protein
MSRPQNRENKVDVDQENITTSLRKKEFGWCTVIETLMRSLFIVEPEVVSEPGF